MTEPKTLDEIRDWFAARDGWYLEYGYGGETWVKAASTDMRSTHPYPATLDAASGAMPENLRLERTFCDHDHVWEWRLWEDIGAGEWCPFWRGGVGVGAIMMRDTGNEIHDRYLLAYRACCAMDGEREKA